MVFEFLLLIVALHILLLREPLQLASNVTVSLTKWKTISEGSGNDHEGERSQVMHFFFCDQVLSAKNADAKA